MLTNEAVEILNNVKSEIEANGLTCPLESMCSALARYLVTASTKRAGMPLQICRYMQLQDYYADDCHKCRGKAIQCGNPEVIEINGEALKQVMIESKKSFPPHMSERRCRPENCRYFEAKETP